VSHNPSQHLSGESSASIRIHGPQPRQNRLNLARRTVQRLEDPLVSHMAEGGAEGPTRGRLTPLDRPKLDEIPSPSALAGRFPPLYLRQFPLFPYLRGTRTALEKYKRRKRRPSQDTPLRLQTQSYRTAHMAYIF
jgi:hypothetical protein